MKNKNLPVVNTHIPRCSMPDYPMEGEVEEQYFGERDTSPFRDGKIEHCRFLLHSKDCNYPNCVALVSTETGETIGLIPRFPLSRVWDMAAIKTNGHNAETFMLTHAEWNGIMNRLSRFVNRGSGKKSSGSSVFMQDIFLISEIEFEQLFLRKGSNAIELMMTAIEADIDQSVALTSRWNRIKHYPHKVSLDSQEGGIFDSKDVSVLQERGIENLNNIRKKDVYFLKNLFLKQDLTNLPEEINAAFKEDLERRKDFRYRFWPIFLGLIALLTTSIIAYIYRYTLIKNFPMTITIISLLAFWVIIIALYVRGIFRARRRRRTKRPTYRFFTGRVTLFSIFFIALSLSTLTSVIVFYERYDGYDDVFFYRNVDENTITIAGLFDGDAEVIDVPTSIDGKETVAISSGALRGSKIRAARIPDTVKEIGARAFKNCKSLVDVVLPSELTVISKSTFEGCSSLSMISLPAGLTEIKEYGFANTALQDVYFQNVRTLGSFAFSECYALRTVRFDRLESVAEGAFDQCGQLVSATLADSTALTAIPEALFRGCISLEETNFATNAVTIGSNVFENCSSLQRFVLPESLEEIGKNVFQNCTSLHELTVPFLGATRASYGGLAYLLNGTAPVSDLTITGGEELGAAAFINIGSLVNVHLPNSIHKIGEEAFRGCSSLTSVWLPSGITEIPARAFEDSSIETLYNSSLVTAVGEGAFRGCSRYGSNDTAKNFLKQLTFIGAEAFKGCGRLSDVSLDAAETVCERAFMGSGSGTLTLFSALQTVKEEAFCESAFRQADLSKVGADAQIGEYIFRNSGVLESIILPGVRTSVPAHLATDCTALSEIVIPAGVKEIGVQAFKNTGVSTLSLPDSVEMIGNEAFAECSSLRSAKFGKGLSTIGEGAFLNCNRLSSVDTQACTQLTAIEASAFENCEALNGFTFTEGLKSIGDKAFKNCRLISEIRLPGSLTALERSAFEGCDLQLVYLPTNSPFAEYFEGISIEYI